MLKGIVTRTEGARIWVEVGERDLPCVLRGRLKMKAERVTSLVVVGDEVIVTEQPDGSGRIEEVLPRRTELSRPGFRGIVHVMAANVDLLVNVQSARHPTFSRHLSERFLVTAKRGGMAAMVVVNKSDLESDENLTEWTEPLHANGVDVLFTSTVTGRGVDELRTRLEGRVSVLAGKSGAGKSSLVNALYPGWDVRTGYVSEWSTKGKHTTTSSRLYPLPGGGYLADTPGIRELALYDGDDEVAASTFPEIQAAAERCKFRDCTHRHEPHCSVKAAVASGQIMADRYQHFIRLQRGDL